MSTKIYGGRLIEIETLAQRVGELPAIIAKHLRPHLVARVAELVANHAYRHQMNLVGASLPSPWPETTDTFGMGTPLSQALAFIAERSAIAEGPREPFDDFGFRLSLWFFPGDLRRMLVLPRSEWSEATTAVMEEIEASEFAYWDNTDRMTGTTQSEWDRRGRLWDEALNTQSMTWSFDARWWCYQLNHDEDFLTAVAETVWTDDRVRLGLESELDARNVVTSQPQDIALSERHLSILRFRVEQLNELISVAEDRYPAGKPTMAELMVLAEANKKIHYGEPWRHLFGLEEPPLAD